MTISELFENQVVATPCQVALADKTNEYSYEELQFRIVTLATYIRGAGLMPNEKVLVCLERNANLVIVLLAVLKAGGAYVVIDPNCPENRIRAIIEDIEPRLAIISAKFQKSFLGKGVGLIDVDSFKFEQNHDAALSNIAEGDDLAYIIYTSGSTGVPKGVMVEHKNSCHFLQWAKQYYNLSTEDVVVAFSPAFFDLSVFEFFAPLVSGAKLIIAERPFDIYEESLLSSITILSMVPSALKTITAFKGLLDEDYVMPKLRHFNFAGEVLEPELVRKVSDKLRPRFIHNCYGPTETTTYATVLTINDRSLIRPSIGFPVGLTRVYILDPDLDCADEGKEGEIFIAGPGVARGYHKRADLTRAKFLPDPLVPHERMYRTGDMGIKLSNGEIQFTGRKDNQVKIKGHRIELGEIEQQLLLHYDVAEAIALTYVVNNGEQSIAAFVVAKQQTIEPEVLKSWLRSKLPSYMIPTCFRLLEAIPITLTGKLDRDALLRQI